MGSRSLAASLQLQLLWVSPCLLEAAALLALVFIALIALKISSLFFLMPFTIFAFLLRIFLQ